MDETPIARMIALNNQALEDIRSLHFRAAQYRLEVALAISETADLERDPITARTHVHLAVVKLTGYKNRAAALADFLAALEIDPNADITRGLETPALRSVYLQARERLGLPPNPDLALPSLKPRSSPSIEGLPRLSNQAATDAAPGDARGTSELSSTAPSDEPERRPVDRSAAQASERDRASPDPPAVVPVPLHCPLPPEVPFGEPLVVRCLTQKHPSRSAAVLYYRQEGDEKTYVAMPMERNPKGWLVAVVPGYALWGKLFVYYVKAEVPGSSEPVTLGDPEDPAFLMVAPPRDEAGREEPSSTSGRSATKQENARRASLGRTPGSFWFALAGGSGVVYHGREAVDSGSKTTSEAPVHISSGFTFAGLLHLEPELGYQWTRWLSVSVMGRFQVAPAQGSYGADEGENEIRTWAAAGFAKARFSARPSDHWQPYAAVGIGGGTSFLATVSRHCPQEPCTLGHSDTVHGGPLGVHLGLGALYHLDRSFGFFVDLNTIGTLPKLMMLAELSFGVSYTYDPSHPRKSVRRMAPSNPDRP